MSECSDVADVWSVLTLSLPWFITAKQSNLHKDLVGSKGIEFSAEYFFSRRFADLVKIMFGVFRQESKEIVFGKFIHPQIELY